MRTLRQRRESASDFTLPPQWPPMAGSDDGIGASASPAAEIVGLVEVVEVVEVVDEVQGEDIAQESTADWVAPIGGQCPDGYPIKANDSSRIFHVPGGRFYDRTVPERCYATAEVAERDGYRRAKA